MNTFADTIRDVAHGEIDDIATKEMASLIAEMQQAQRLIGGKQKGTLTVKVSFALEHGGAFATTAEVTVKRPPKAKPYTLLYPTKDGSLSEEDTRQGKFDFGNAKDVSTPDSTKVRDIRDGRSLAANDSN